MSTNPKIPMTAITGLSVDELYYLAQWCVMKQETFPRFTVWLFNVAQAEGIRRQSDGAIEPGDIESPDFDASLLSDALVGCYVLSRQAMTEKLSEFIDVLDSHIVGASSAMLSEIAEMRLQVK